ncbi:MAG: DUF1573 domain-containing protein [Thermodesulfobacteriota bacterium]
MMIRKAMMYGMLLAVLITAMGAQSAFGESAAPLAVIESPTHDFGAVYAGEKILHTFEIRNEGDAPLKIEKVKTG